MSTLSGNVAHIALVNRLASDLGTAHDFFYGKAMTALSLKVGDTADYYKFTSAAIGKYLQISSRLTTGENSTIGTLPYWISFAPMYNPRAFLGCLNMDDIKILNATVTHALGADSSVLPVSFRSAQFVIENERLKVIL